MTHCQAGLATIINRDPEMTVIATAENGQQAIDCFREYQPDVTLMDLRMPQVEVEAISAICAEFKPARIIVQQPTMVMKISIVDYTQVLKDICSRMLNRMSC